MKIEIKSQFNGSVIYATELDCPDDTPNSLALGWAVLEAISKKINLRGADLRGANLLGVDLSWVDLSWVDLSWVDLSGANLLGAKYKDCLLKLWVSSISRSDGHQFTALETEAGMMIIAGCRWFSADQYRQHIEAEYPDTDKAAETLDIIEFFEKRRAALAK